MIFKLSFVVVSRVLLSEEIIMPRTKHLLTAVFVGLSGLLLVATSSSAQLTPLEPPPEYQFPTQVNANDVKTLVPEVRSLALSGLSDETKTALAAEAKGAALELPVTSIARWFGSFSFHGRVVVPFTMVGGAPGSGGTTFIGTQLIPLSLIFDGLIDPKTGNLPVINIGSAVARTLAGPDFAKAAYGSGTTQFSDAVQRAEFHAVKGPGWHTLLNPPTMLTPVTIEVPLGDAQVFEFPDGTLFCKMDINFLHSQLTTILQLEGIRARQLPILLIRNTLLYQNGNPADCCVGGFHSAFVPRVTASSEFVQTYAYATWLDAEVLNDSVHADVWALSHEITEWMNDPFVNNLVNPPKGWQFPGSSSCQDNLETGDPVEVLPSHVAFPVTLGGFTYHPQNEALFQWFAQGPSNAIDGAYSYPDEIALTTPSISCP
jgi:hypothetical protein